MSLASVFAGHIFLLEPAVIDVIGVIVIVLVSNVLRKAWIIVILLVYLLDTDFIAANFMT